MSDAVMPELTLQGKLSKLMTITLKVLGDPLTDNDT